MKLSANLSVSMRFAYVLVVNTWKTPNHLNKLILFY